MIKHTSTPLTCKMLRRGVLSARNAWRRPLSTNWTYRPKVMPTNEELETEAKDLGMDLEELRRRWSPEEREEKTKLWLKWMEDKTEPIDTRTPEQIERCRQVDKEMSKRRVQRHNAFYKIWEKRAWLKVEAVKAMPKELFALCEKDFDIPPPKELDVHCKDHPHDFKFDFVYPPQPSAPVSEEEATQ